MRKQMRFDGKQQRFIFPLSFQDIAFPAQASGRESEVRDRQPKKFPQGWYRLSLNDPDWRAKHYTRWSEKRMAAGLPHVVHEREAA